MLLELRLARRSLMAQPLVSISVVFTAALAIAANTALFSVFDGLLFRPLPYKQSDRIVRLDIDPAVRSQGMSPEAEARAEATPSLIERADVRARSLFDVTGPAVADWGLRAYGISTATFDLLGVNPVFGRRFNESDAESMPFTVLLGYDVWRTRFGRDPSIVGRDIDIPGTAPTERWHVVGVMPEGFAFPDGANFWTPIYRSYGPPTLHTFARLAPGVTLESVRAELPGVVVTPLREYLRPEGARALGVLLAATALLLLVAWVQVAGLLLMRAAGRLTEMGVRLALGASRARLARQFAVEAAVLMLASFGLAALGAPALTAFIVWALPPAVTLGQDVAPDSRAFLFAALLSAVGLAVFTCLPVDLVRRASPIGLLRRETFGGLRPHAIRFRTALFVGQLALAAALVYLAGLTLHSFVRISDAPLGFEPAGLYAIKMPRGDAVIPVTGRERLDRQRAMVAETIDALERLTGVAMVSGSHAWPMQGAGLLEGTLVAESDPSRLPVASLHTVILRGYPDVLRVSLLEGAEPSAAELDNVRMPPDVQLALANRALARHLAQFGSPIGQTVARTRSLRYRIVGVMPDVVLERADRAVAPTMFHYLPPPAAPGVVLARIERDRTPEQVGIPTALERIWGASAPRAFPVADSVRQAYADYRARTLILSLICLLSVPLTVAGVAGALGHATKARTREIAIELALGAEPRSVERRVVKQAVTAAGLALFVGVAVGAGIGRLMSSALFGVGAADLSAIAGAGALTLGIAWLSALVPARRASRISPAEALRRS